MELVIPSLPDKPAFEFERVPDLDEVSVRAGNTEADIRLWFSKSNRVIIQDVFVQPFTENVAQEVFEKLQTSDVEAARHRWEGATEFKVVTARLTCAPDPDCKFTWLRISFELGKNEETLRRPIACALYPASEEDTIEITSTVEISGEMTIKIAKIGSKGTEGVKVVQHQPKITAHGAFSPSPEWQFKKTGPHPEVTGDFTLLMVVACPQGVQNTAQISLSASAELRSGGIIPGIMRRKSDNAATVTFTL